jgi:hypothetical protein
VSPWAFTLESTNTSATSCQNWRTPARCNSGTAATTAALARSASTLERLNPSRSTSGPPSTAGMTAPMASAPLTIPVRAALPVVSSTNQGKATMAIMLPICPTPSAVNSE